MLHNYWNAGIRLGKYRIFKTINQLINRNIHECKYDKMISIIELKI